MPRLSDFGVEGAPLSGFGVEGSFAEAPNTRLGTLEPQNNRYMLSVI